MKHKRMSVIVFEPSWAKKQGVDKRHPLKYGEHVLYLGDIPNVPGHCAVAKYEGQVVWLVHPEDFREAAEDEL